MTGQAPTVLDDWLETAFQTAFFILDDREQALRVVTNAAARLEVAAATQGKRLYYRPKADTAAGTSRSKVVLDEAHLFQRLVFIEAEPFERKKEIQFYDHPEHHERMVVHFIKHLIQSALKRNSFYVTLGLCRLLYGYTTPETMAIYGRLVPDENEAKDDHYYRSRKGKLIGELQERFGEMIEVVQGAHGERKIRSVEDPTPFTTLVRNSLGILSLWEIAGTPGEAGRPTVQSDGNRKGISFTTEIERIQTITHPDASHRFITGLGFAPPAEKLEIPSFRLPPMKKNAQSNPHGPSLPSLSEADMRALKSDVASRSERRRSAPPDSFSVRVDGIEYARFNPVTASNVSFDVDEDAEIVDIVSETGGFELTLASMFLKRDRSGELFLPDQASVTLEGGQRISFVCEPKQGVSDVSPSATVQVQYAETAPGRVLGLSVQKAGRRIFPASLAGWRLNPTIAIPGLATLLLAASAGAIVVIRNSGPFGEPQKVATAKDPIEKPTPPPVIDKPEVDKPGPENGADPLVKPNRKAPEYRPRQRATKPPLVEELRGESLNVSELREVKSIFIEIAGPNPDFNQLLLPVLKAGFEGNGKVTVSEQKDDADALMEVRVGKDSPATRPAPPSTEDQNRPTSIFVRLLNGRGQIIWTGSNGGKFIGTPAEISRKIASELASSIEKAQAKS